MTIHKKAFTLVEVAVVIVLGGLLIAAFSAYIVNFITQSRIKTTESRIEQIHDALITYATTNKKLPCVASRVAAMDTLAYGREVGTDCAAAPAGGTSGNVVHTHAGKRIRIGALPTRDLNLPDEYGYDAWGTRLIYAVTENQTVVNGYNPSNGGIGLIDSGNNSIVTPDNSVTFLIVSTGSDRKGGFSNAGTLISGCTSAPGNDVENCDDDGIFRQTLITSTSAGATYYDDYMIYGGAVSGTTPTATNAFIGSVTISKAIGAGQMAACNRQSGVGGCSCTGIGTRQCTITCSKGTPELILSVPVTAADASFPASGLENFYACIDDGAPSGSITVSIPPNTGSGPR